MLPIYLLSAAGFTVLTTEFLIIGFLPSIARDLDVSVSQAGLLVTLFAFTVASVGPLLTATFAHFERKNLFVGTLLLCSLANTIAALAPNIGVMAVARFIPAFALPVFWALASDSAINILGSNRAGKALSLITFGVVCATVFGIPIGALIADAFGWRSAFGILAVVAFAKALMLQRYLPKLQIKSDKVSVLQQFKLLRDPVILGHVCLSILLFTAMFTTYTYLADMLEQIAGFDGSLVGWTLMAFGAIGLVGNAVGGRIVDWNPFRSSLIFSILMGTGMIVLIPSFSSAWGMTLALGVWGIAQPALFIVCHVRLMMAVPQAPAFAASLNISGANIGIGLGAIVGGKVIDGLGIERLGLAAAAIVGMSVLLTFALMQGRRLQPYD